MAIGLFPILWSTGTGADLMKRIAVPMVGGLTSSFVMELLVYPVVYSLWRQRELIRRLEVAAWRGPSIPLAPGSAVRLSSDMAKFVPDRG